MHYDATANIAFSEKFPTVDIKVISGKMEYRGF